MRKVWKLIITKYITGLKVWKLKYITVICYNHFHIVQGDYIMRAKFQNGCLAFCWCLWGLIKRICSRALLNDSETCFKKKIVSCKMAPRNTGSKFAQDLNSVLLPSITHSFRGHDVVWLKFVIEDSRNCKACKIRCFTISGKNF